MPSELQAEPGSAMCTLCGFAKRIDANVERAEGVTSAVGFALHFALKHPDVLGGVSRYIVMAPEASPAAPADREEPQ